MPLSRMRMESRVGRVISNWKLRACVLGALLLCLLIPAKVSDAQETPGNVADTAQIDPGKSFIKSASTSSAPSNGILDLSKVPDLTKRENVSAAIQLLVLLTVISLAPAILVMMTSFTRIVIVLSLLRQALGTQQLPPNQVLIGLSLFMTCVVMGPTWQRLNGEALQPYMNGTMTSEAALANAQAPLRGFMIKQIRAAKNDEDVFMMCEASGKPDPQTWQDVDTFTL